MVDSQGVFTPAELSYLRSQPLGRLGTLLPGGAPQLSPVGFFVDEATGVIDVRGHSLGASRKFRNVEADPRVSFVVDDVPDPRDWKPRGVEIRGRAEALRDAAGGPAWASPEVIRIRAERIISWGIETDSYGASRRDVQR